MGEHRASRRTTPSVSPLRSPSTAGKRRAAKPARVSARRLLPSAPVAAGIATLAVAGFGATYGGVSAADVQPAAAKPSAFAPAGALSGTTVTASSDLLAERGTVVSRSASRGSVGAGATTSIAKKAEKAAEQRNEALAQVDKQVASRAKHIAENAWVMPLDHYRISAHFGAASYLWSRVHTGQDLAVPSGTPIHSVANGVVTDTGYEGSYGYRTIVTLDDGTEIWYCHQTTIMVSVGQRVNGGDVIGLSGNTGNSTGPHLHLEVRPGGGDPVDPVGAFAQHGLSF